MKKILFIALLAATVTTLRAATFTNSTSVDSFVRASAPTSNYGGSGANAVSGSTATNGLRVMNGASDSFIRFNTAAMVSSFNSTFGANNWVITNAALQVTEQGAPMQTIFNRGKGAFEIRWIANDTWTEGTGTPQTPTSTGIIYNNEPSLLNVGTDVSLGNYTNAGVDGALSYQLPLPAALVSDIQAGGEVGFFMTAIDPNIGFTFNARSFGTTTARPFLLVSATVILHPPVITSPAASSTVTADAGTSTTLSITATGATSYQWKKDGVNLTDGSADNRSTISGSTTASLTLSDVRAADAGAYTCNTHNTDGDALSLDTTLVINDPVITVAPVDSTFECGSTSNLTVTAIGTTNLIYQWLNGGTPITDATNATLPFANVSIAAAGTYSVIVSNALGNSITSAPAIVTIVDTTVPVVTLNGPDIESVAQHAAYNEEGATANDVCDGTLTPSISGGVDAETLGIYTLIYSATDSSGNTGTATRTVTVFVGSPTIDTPPSAQTVNAGSTLVLTAVAHASTALSYQWKKDGSPLADGAHNGSLSSITGATTSSLSISNVLRADVGSYTVDVTANVTVSTDPVSVGVTDPVFDVQPQAQVRTVGSNVVFTAHASGTPLPGFGAPFLRYQWYRQTNALHPAAAIAKQTNTTLTLNLIKATDQGTYYCVVTNRILTGALAGTGASNTSATVTLTVYVKPAVSNPANVTITAGKNAIFRVKATGSTPYTYQWARNSVPLSSDGSHIIGATTSALTIINAQDADHGTYQCTVGNLSSVTATSTNSRGILIVQPDGTRPVASILRPGSNARMTNGLAVIRQVNIAPSVEISGNAVDNGLITNVNLTRIYPPWAPPISVNMNADNGLLYATLPGRKLWTNIVTLVDGTNTFVATATDSAGLTSTNAGGKRSFFLRTTNLLTVIVNGTGHTVPVTALYGSASNNASLENGRGYFINAVRNAGAANASVTFVDWRDGNDNLLTNGPTGHLLHFVMTNDLILKANFNH